MSNWFSRLMRDLTTRYEERELARGAGRHHSTINRWKNQTSEPKINQLRDLSLWLCEDDCTAVAEMMITPEYEITKRGEGRANGDIDDDIATITEGLGKLRDAWRQQDTEAFQEGLRMIDKGITNAKTEGDRL